MEAAFVDTRKTAVYEPTTEASGFSSTGNSTWDSAAGLQLIRHVSSNIPCSSCSSSQSDSSCDSFCLDEMVSEFMEEDSDAGDAGDGYDCRTNSFHASQARSARKSDVEPAEALAARDGSQRPSITRDGENDSGGRDSPRCVGEKRDNHVYDAPADAWRCQFCGGAQCDGVDCQRHTSYNHHGVYVNQQRTANSSCSEIEQLASMIEPLSCCETPEEYAVLDVVTSAMEHTVTSSADLRTSGSSSSSRIRNTVVQQLRGRGYDAAVCYSQWDYSNGIPDGSHEYCDVILHPSTPHRPPERLIVDLEFRAQPRAAVVGLLARGMKELALHRQAVV
ncbi:unnamed protein product [Closterium sp. Naga37s-1]|nr:unnamed protein product [Closterium sp. Naga37s-1]